MNLCLLCYGATAYVMLGMVLQRICLFTQLILDRVVIIDFPRPTFLSPFSCLFPVEMRLCFLMFSFSIL